MSPAGNIAASQLRQLIFYYIDNDFLDNANFLAGRLHALEPRNPDSSHLLALTYLRLRRHKAAFDYSQKYGANGRHLGCAYVFALACLELGRNQEGALALEKAKALWVGKSHWNKHSETSRRHLPDAAAAHALQAKLWRAHGDLPKAGDAYVEAHKANPFIWDAFEGLCKIGADCNLPNMFRPTAEMVGAGIGQPVTTIPEIWTDDARPSNQPLAPQVNFNHQNVLTPSNDPFNTVSRTAGLGLNAGSSFMLPKIKGKAIITTNLKTHSSSEWDTPTANGGLLDDDVTMGELQAENEMLLEEPPAAPTRIKSAAQRLGLGLGRDTTKVVPPAVRGQMKSSSDSIAEDESSQFLRKPSTHKRTISGHASQASTASAVDTSVPRRSGRLTGQTAATRSNRPTVESTASLAARADRETRPARAATGTKGKTGSTVGRVVSGNRKVMPPDPSVKDKRDRAPSRNSEKSVTAPTVTAAQCQKAPSEKPLPVSDGLAEQQALIALLDNFRQLAVGCYATSRFQLPEAIHTFRSLPTAQRETPWVLAQLGKAHYEAADYKAAEDCFARVMKLQPSRVEDMEVYSTVLWHLKKESALAFLCHTLRDQDFHAPQTWCAVGNAFSLAREHDQAISAFKRATQLDASFAYAWTLMGHEYIANEEFDAAMHAFRKSVGVEQRGYGGWYGLGKCYERIGQFEQAERHYRIAANINSSNATLLVCIGVVLERLRKREAALVQYHRALELSPMSALARFKKARVLMHLQHFQEALLDLDILRNQAPDEANVWFLLGKCYKGLNERSEAVRAFTTAMNLDVKVRFRPATGQADFRINISTRLRRSSKKRWTNLTKIWWIATTSERGCLLLLHCVAFHFCGLCISTDGRRALGAN